ncbi:MAG: zinc-ribbon domain-containing protein [Lachnospiraceae bacterium]|nr:zinc-ribbon domain-containing protein [Lachnospiraceae bacterium]
MFCNQCGKQLADDAMFCPDCGAKQEPVVNQAPVAPQPMAEPVAPQPVAPQPMAEPVAPQPVAPQPMAAPVMPQPVAPAVPKEKKENPFNLKLLIPVAGVFVVVVILLVVLLAGKGGSAGFVEVDKDMVLYTGDSFINLEGDSLEVDDYVREAYSGNGSTAVYYSDGTLYYVSKELEEFEISESVAGFRVSFTGDYVVYTVYEDDNWSDYHTTLYVYDVKKDNSVKIDTDVYAYSLCVSPSGGMVAYLKDYEGYTDNALYIGGIEKDSEKIDKDGCFPVAISANGKHFYYINEDAKLYYYNGKEADKIETDVSSSIWVNPDVSEILFVKNGKTYYYTPKMEEPAKVSGNYTYEIVTPECELSVIDNGTYYCSDYATIVRKESFKNSVLVTDSGLYWLNNKGTDTVKITSYNYCYQIAEDGKSLLFIEDGELCKITKFNEDMEPKVLYEDEYLIGFVASADLKKIYIVTDDDELFYYKSSSKIEEISDDFEYYEYSIAFNEATGKIFYIEDDDLYCAGTSSKSNEEIQEEVGMVAGLFEGVLFRAEEDDEAVVYYMKKEPVELYINEY